MSLELAKLFQLDSNPISCDAFGNGRINTTFVVRTESSRRYILQKINSYIFKNVEGLMHNIYSVTSFLQKQVQEENEALCLVPAKDGSLWVTDECDGSSWRVFKFIEDGVCLEAAENTNDFYQSAVAFGNFQYQMADFPVHTLVDTIPNFHNTPLRFEHFHEAIQKDAVGRVHSVQKEIDYILAREDKAGILCHMGESGLLPIRVTHNDTKLNNVMLRKSDHTPLCILDLDTVMPGLSSYDYGDAIRFGAATAGEEERNMDLVSVDLDLMRAFTRGFLESCPSFTESEKNLLPLGAWSITVEQSVRFLTDYIEGDPYYGASYPEQNLLRTQVQLKLLQDMELKDTEIQKMLNEEIQRIGNR